MKNKQTVSHKDHRSRLRSKVAKNGLSSLAEHEVLELLLTYIIPRKDTNPLAHRLIDYFGGFANVFDASVTDLQKVEGVGPSVAFFLTTFSPFMDIYKQSKMKADSIKLDTTKKCVDFFREYYPIKNNEFMIILCLSKLGRVIKTLRYDGIDETQINFNLNKIIKDICFEGVNSIVIFHTHPFGDILPSLSDLDVTQKLLNLCLVNAIKVSDHIVLNETNYYSFKMEGVLDKMIYKFDQVFNIKDIKVTGKNKFNN